MVARTSVSEAQSQRWKQVVEPNAKAAADPAVESDQSQRPSDLTTAPATDTLEAAGESQVILARAEESQAEESQAFV